MKKIFSIIYLLLFSHILCAQKSFVWEKIDSVNKEKSQIYSASKIFITEYWKSAQNVIQNDDKENGIIIVKGSTILYCNFLLNIHKFIFDYTVRFYMKDKKYRIQIDNVINTSHTCEGHVWTPIEPTENYKGDANLSTKRRKEIFTQLQNELQSIVDNYEKFIKSASKTDW